MLTRWQIMTADRQEMTFSLRAALIVFVVSGPAAFAFYLLGDVAFMIGSAALYTTPGDVCAWRTGVRGMSASPKDISSRLYTLIASLGGLFIRHSFRPQSGTTSEGDYGWRCTWSRV